MHYLSFSYSIVLYPASPSCFNPPYPFDITANQNHCIGLSILGIEIGTFFPNKIHLEKMYFKNLKVINPSGKPLHRLLAHINHLFFFAGTFF
jgi:hypothetical protein